MGFLYCNIFIILDHLIFIMGISVPVKGLIYNEPIARSCYNMINFPQNTKIVWLGMGYLLWVPSLHAFHVFIQWKLTWVSTNDIPSSSLFWFSSGHFHVSFHLYGWCFILNRKSFVLTHLPLDKMAAISLTISNAILLMKSFLFWLKFHWSLFPMAQMTILRYWFR